MNPLYTMTLVAFLLVLCAAAPRVERWIAYVLRRTLYVDPTTGDDAAAERGNARRPYRSIPAAIDASHDFATVLCSPGLHTIDQPITASSRRHIILRGVDTRPRGRAF